MQLQELEEIIPSTTNESYWYDIRSSIAEAYTINGVKEIGDNTRDEIKRSRDKAKSLGDKNLVTKANDAIKHLDSLIQKEITDKIFRIAPAIGGQAVDVNIRYSL